jgi:hypothetical protein
MVTLQSVVQYAARAVSPGVSYLEFMSAEATFPVAHALRIAGCADIAAAFIGPDITATCTPTVIQDLARRSGVVTIDLNAF